ncbi:hypothetical protein DSM100688_1874 [Bifidobacterium ramosum]|uniref:Tetratricopeptide repeat protein n=1 Tax=Bifidobacterium ramosum TaxID=1798158 RepID=A0A6L4WYE1_9BIFI|nr:hypothetical protein [Bifidobacterium ramosum]KAB8287099.1 hypothetical protein DSM100688_1874 [Bifidobacterium ramosum]NEG71838.1 hypothetical protein [Bifidobacterium ramosum]
MSVLSNDYDVCAAFRALGSALNKPLIGDSGEVSLRGNTINRMLGILGRYGLTDGVLRYGFADHVASPLLFRAMNLIPNDLYPESLLSRWKRILVKGDLPDSLLMLSDRYMMLAKWMASADLRNIIDLEPPSDEEWDKLRLTPDEDAVVSEQYQWLYDRYLFTELNAWSTTSLHYEYRYVVDKEIGDFPERAVEELPVTRSELVEIIANRAVYSSKESVLEYRLYSQVYESALAHLKKGDCEQAATLFDFFLRQYPGNMTALNAKGFCLIPVDTDKAEKLIRQAVCGGLPTRGLGIYNICYCRLLRGDVMQALQEADKYWCEFRESERGSTPAIIWQVGRGGKAELVSTESTDASIAKLCAAAADSIGDDVRRTRWQHRAEVLDAATAPAL